jgi:hypothetical protein
MKTKFSDAFLLTILLRFVPLPYSCSMFLVTIIICILVASVSGNVLSINDCSQWNDGNQICIRANLYRDGTLVSEVRPNQIAPFMDVEVALWQLEVMRVVMPAGPPSCMERQHAAEEIRPARAFRGRRRLYTSMQQQQNIPVVSTSFTTSTEASARRNQIRYAILHQSPSQILIHSTADGKDLW